MPELNADFSKPAVMRTDTMTWQSSPGTGVWRKRLELLGEVESGRVTSVVRYDAGSRFPPHEHPDGEEILVLDGVFSDEHGDYPTGTYILNPEGFTHAPYSVAGCVLFVKLRQYPGLDRRQIVIDTNTATWVQSDIPGREVQALYEEPEHPEKMRMVRLQPGIHLPEHEHPGGEETLIIDGSIADEAGRYARGTWVRFPDASRHRPYSDEGCTLYVKTGHLRASNPA